MLLDLDECEENVATCPEGELCRNTVGSYTCVCPMGYIRQYDKFGTEGPCTQATEVQAEMQMEEAKGEILLLR